MDTFLCPCGSNLRYADCCQRYHIDHQAAVSAEILMRSRYSAFVLKLNDYLLETWHAASRPASLDLTADTTQWIKLKILNCKNGKTNDTQGLVEFKAYYQLNKGIGCLHEISRFRHEDGKWFYVDGKIKPTRIKPGFSF